MPNELVSQADPVMAMISTAIDKGMEVASLQGLFEMQRQWAKDQAANKFAVSITGFQSVCPPVPKTKEVRNRNKDLMYKFADYADMLEIVQPYLTKFEIVPTFSFPVVDGNKMVCCRIRVGTHVEETFIPAAVPEILNTNESQRLGGMTSFFMRYGLKAALNIRVIGEDNNAAGLDKVISADEAKSLDSMMKEVSYFSGQTFQRGPFLNWLVEGLESLEGLPADKFSQATMELTRKRQEAFKSSKKKE